MADEKKKGPSTLGEWDAEVDKLSEADLNRYRAALDTLKSWEAFRLAFQWTRVFVLIDTIQFGMDRKARALATRKIPPDHIPLSGGRSVWRDPGKPRGEARCGCEDFPCCGHGQEN